MYFELAVLAITLGTYAYHRWIEDHPKPPPGVARTPRVDEGAPVPLIYGKCRVRAPILAWSGSQRSVPIQDRFAYFLDMLYVVGIPFYGGRAQLSAVYAGDVTFFLNAAAEYPVVDPDSTEDEGNAAIKSLPRWGDSNMPGRSNYWVTNTPARVFRDDLQIIVNDSFVEFFDGRPEQVITDGVDDADSDALTDIQGVLEAKPMNGMYVYVNDDHDGNVLYPLLPPNLLPSQIPSYRNMAICCLYRWSNGDGIELPAYSFEVTSISTGSASYMGQSLDFEADPAAVIHDLLTSPFGKLGISADRVDLPSFQAASLTLFNEGHGYSRAIDQAEEASAIIQDILRQIDGVIYEEPTTGKIVLKLVRSDYNPSELDDVNPDNARPSGSGWFSVQGWSETINQVRVTFTDRQNFYADGLAIGQNTANVVAQHNRIRSVDLHYPGCCTRELAQKLASRELGVLSRPQVRASMLVGRSFHRKRPGDVVTFTWPELGIAKMVMRIARVTRGPLRNGGITLEMVRDVFDVSLGAYPPAAA